MESKPSALTIGLGNRSGADASTSLPVGLLELLGIV
jgi:hypothetical protein